MATNESPLIAGDIIFSIKPILHIVNQENYCHNCLKSSNDLKRCSKCRQKYYCEQNCQQMDWNHHKKECKVLRKKSYFRNYAEEEVLWPEILLIRLWSLIKSDETFASKRYKLFDGSDMSLNDIKVNVKEVSEESLRKNGFEVICKHFKEYGIDFISEELLHWYGLITTSPIVCEFKSYASFTGKKTVELMTIPSTGVGLYPDLHIVSHSCVPNCALVTNDLWLQLRAIKEISIGTQITRDFIEQMINKKERHEKLKQMFLINVCKCLKCEPNPDLNIDYDYLRSLCEKCEQRMVQILFTPEPSPVIEMKYKQALIDSEKMINMAIEAMGPYSPHNTFPIIVELGIRGKCSELSGEPIDYKFYLRLEEHIRITYGVNHPIYIKMISERPIKPPVIVHKSQNEGKEDSENQKE